MADNRITITFNSFDDFKQFLINPGTVRLNQIAMGKMGYVEAIQEAIPVPSQALRPLTKVANQSEGGRKRLKRATPSQSRKIRTALLSNLTSYVQTHAGPMSAGDLVRKALTQVGKRATERNMELARTTLVRMANMGDIRRASRGFYTVPAVGSQPKLVKASAKVMSRK